MTDADLEAVFAYLRSLPPIRNEVPENKVPPEVIDAMSVATKRQLAEETARRAKEAKR